MAARSKRLLRDPDRALTYVDRRLGRDVLNRSNLLSTELAGWLAVRRARLLSDSSPTTSNHPAALKLTDCGIAEVGQLHDDDLIRRIAERFDEIIEENTPIPPAREERTTGLVSTPGTLI